MPTSTGRQKQATPLDEAARNARAAFIVVGIFSFFLNLLYLVTPLYMMQVYDRVLASGSRPTLFYLTVIAILALIVFGALEALRTSTLARAGQWFNERLSAPALRSSVEAATASGQSRLEALRDVAQIQGFVGGAAINPFFDAPWTPIFVAVIWLLHPWLGVLAVLVGLVLFGLAILNEALTREPLREANAASSAVLRDGARLIEQSETVQAMGMLSALEARWTRSNAAAQSRQTVATEIGGTLQGASRFVRMAAQIAVLGLGALLVLLGEMSAGSMIAASILLGRALAPVEQLIGTWRSFIGARMGYQRLQKLFTETPPRKAAMELPAARGALSVEDLYVRAPGTETLLLKGLSFAVEPGEVVAVIGPSAAGKSTMCRAILGTMPAFRGTVRLDGADIGHWPREQFGQAIGYLSQSVELFDGSVRDNIARMAECEDADVTRAAQSAGVHEMVLRLPAGYDTPIGPGGVNLSAGQRQRIGLARAIFGHPRLVLLDEPNSNLDQTGEQALMRSILMMKQSGAAVILVAHRQSALAVADKILVLNEGAVEMFDERDSILKIMAERRRFTGRQSEPGPSGKDAAQ